MSGLLADYIVTFAMVQLLVAQVKLVQTLEMQILIFTRKFRQPSCDVVCGDLIAVAIKRNILLMDSMKLTIRVLIVAVKVLFIILERF